MSEILENIITTLMQSNKIFKDTTNKSHLPVQVQAFKTTNKNIQLKGINVKTLQLVFKEEKVLTTDRLISNYSNS